MGLSWGKERKYFATENFSKQVPSQHGPLLRQGEEIFRDSAFFETSPLSTWAYLGARRGNISRQHFSKQVPSQHGPLLGQGEEIFSDRECLKTSPLSTWASLGARGGNILRHSNFKNKSPLNMGLSWGKWANYFVTQNFSKQVPSQHRPSWGKGLASSPPLHPEHPSQRWRSWTPVLGPPCGAAPPECKVCHRWRPVVALSDARGTAPMCERRRPRIALPDACGSSLGAHERHGT